MSLEKELTTTQAKGLPVSSMIPLGNPVLHMDFIPVEAFQQLSKVYL